MNINDGPTASTYGWLACAVRNDFGLPNAGIADCLTYVAQGQFSVRSISLCILIYQISLTKKLLTSP
jgi:hypothetical protein